MQIEDGYECCVPSGENISLKRILSFCFFYKFQKSLYFADFKGYLGSLLNIYRKVVCRESVCELI